MIIYQKQKLADAEDRQKLSHYFLKIAEGRLYQSPTLVQTVLGSCVSVTMFCPQLRCGGIFHALLPCIDDFSKPENSKDCDTFRYVDSSIWNMLKKFDESGVSAKNLECKVFGGSSSLYCNNGPSPGSRNVKVAMEVLAEAGATVLASSVGGSNGRKIYFRTDTGVVLQKQFKVRA